MKAQRVEKYMTNNPGLKEQIENATIEDYEDISLEELHKFIEELNGTTDTNKQ